MVHAENAKVHILEDEAASRAYFDLMWAEAMFFYHNFPVRLTLSKEMNKELKVLQRQFMPEDTKAGLIQSFLDNYSGTQVCSKLIYAEALNHSFDEAKRTRWRVTKRAAEQNSRKSSKMVACGCLTLKSMVMGAHPLTAIVFRFPQCGHPSSERSCHSVRQSKGRA